MLRKKKKGINGSEAHSSSSFLHLPYLGTHVREWAEEIARHFDPFPIWNENEMHYGPQTTPETPTYPFASD